MYPDSISLNESTDTISSLCTQAIHALHERRQPEIAINTVVLAIQRAQAAFGDRHLNTIRCHLVAIEVYLATGQAQKAENEARHAMEILFEDVGPEHDYSVESMIWFAKALLAQHRESESAKAVGQAMIMFRNGIAAGKEQSLDNLEQGMEILYPMTMRNKDLGKSIEPLLDDIIFVAKQHIAAGSQVLTKILYTKCLLLNCLDRKEEVIAALKEIIEGLTKSPNAYTEILPFYKERLAEQFMILDKPYEAEIAYKEMLSGFIELNGQEHIFSINGRHVLAKFYFSQGQHEKAERYYVKAHQAAVENGDPDIRSTTAYILALFYYSIKRFALADKHFSESVRLQRKTAEPDPEYMSSIIFAMADNYLEWGKLKAARREYEKGLRILNDEIDTMGSKQYFAHANLSMILDRQDRFRESLEHLRKALRIAITISGPQGKQTMSTAASMESMLEKLDEPGDVLNLIGQEMAQLITPPGMQDPFAIAALEIIRNENPWEFESLELIARDLIGKPDGKLKKRSITRKATRLFQNSQYESAWLLTKFDLLIRKGRCPSGYVEKITSFASLAGVERAVREMEFALIHASQLGLPTILIEYALSKICLFSANWQRAYKYAKHCLDQDNEFHNLEQINDAAYCLANLGTNPKQALQMARQVHDAVFSHVQLFSRYKKASVSDTLGLAFLKDGQLELAIEHLQIAQKFDPRIVHEYHLAMAYYLSGDFENARILLEKNYQAKMARAINSEERKILEKIFWNKADPALIWGEKAD